MRIASVRAYRGKVVGDVDEGRLLRRGPSESSVSIEWAMGSDTPSGAFATTFGTPLYLHERAIKLLSSSGASGWEPFAVDVRSKKGAEVDGFFGLRVTGRAGPIDDARSVRTTRPFPAGPREIWLGWYFDPSSWDGSDVFAPDGTDAVLVVDRVRDALKGVKNLSFEPITEIERLML